MFQFFIEQGNITDNTIEITNKNDVLHISKSLRLSVGDTLNLVVQNQNIYTVEIVSINIDTITTKVIEKNEVKNRLGFNLTLAQSVLKAAKQDVVIQKATELGVKSIIPLTTKNTVVLFDSQKDRQNKIERWTRIANESSKQCKRADIPTISDILPLKELFTSLSDYDLVICCTEKNAKSSMRACLKDYPNSKDILVIIGPEGGWDSSEIKLFEENNIQLVSLGNLILRAETAVITTLSNIIYEYEL